VHGSEVVAVDAVDDGGVGQVGTIRESGGDSEGPALQKPFDDAAFAW